MVVPGWLTYFWYPIRWLESIVFYSGFQVSVSEIMSNFIAKRFNNSSNFSKFPFREEMLE